MRKICEGNLFQRLPFLTWKLSENRLKSIKIMISALLPSFNLALTFLTQHKLRAEHKLRECENYMFLFPTKCETICFCSQLFCFVCVSLYIMLQPLFVCNNNYQLCNYDSRPKVSPII